MERAVHAPDLDTAGPRKRAAHLGPERRRPLVLDAAYSLFVDGGYEGTSMDDVARAAGVSKPVVYDCFASKQELFNAMLDREEARILGETRDALGTAAGDDPEATLIEGFTAFLRAVSASPETYRIVFLGEGAGNDAVAARISRGVEMQAGAAAAIARRWVERFSEREGEDAEAAALLLGQVIVGLAQAGARTLLRDPGRWRPETLGEALGRMAWASRTAV